MRKGAVALWEHESVLRLIVIVLLIAAAIIIINIDCRCEAAVGQRS
jgi:hypothetical protein